MKKLMSVMLMMISLGAFASVGEVVTNYVYVVSNQYFRTFEVHEVTNKVKNTHINYYTTNYETKVVQVANLTYKTNVTILADVSQQAIIAASNQANRAAEQVEYARQSAYDSASSASEASWYESQAHMFCDNAASKVYEVNRIGDEKISAMNAKQTWFDNNYGKLITNYNYYSVNKLVANGENIYGVHRYVLYINGVRQPDYWVEIDFSQYSAAYSGGQCWAYTVWRQSPKNNTSNHSYVYSRTMHTSYAGGLIRDERSAFNKFTMLTTNGGYAQGYFYQGALNNPRNAYPARVLTHYKYSGYEYRIDDDPKWYVYGDLRIVDQETGESVDRLVTSNSLANAFARVATTGSYNDLNNKPTLSTVATTGSYNDLNNRPDSDYAARFSSLEGHEVTVNDELVYLKKRLAVLEAFHSVVPPPDPHPDPEPEK